MKIEYVIKVKKLAASSLYAGSNNASDHNVVLYCTKYIDNMRYIRSEWPNKCQARVASTRD